MALLLFVSSFSSLGVALGLSDVASANGDTVEFDKSLIVKAALGNLDKQYAEGDQSISGDSTFTCEGLVFDALVKAGFTSIGGKPLVVTGNENTDINDASTTGTGWFAGNLWGTGFAGKALDAGKTTGSLDAVWKGQNVKINVTYYENLATASLEPGDIIAWETNSDTNPNGHVAIVVNNNTDSGLNANLTDIVNNNFTSNSTATQVYASAYYEAKWLRESSPYKDISTVKNIKWSMNTSNTGNMGIKNSSILNSYSATVPGNVFCSSDRYQQGTTTWVVEADSKEFDICITNMAGKAKSLSSGFVYEVNYSQNFEFDKYVENEAGNYVVDPDGLISGATYTLYNDKTCTTVNTDYIIKEDGTSICSALGRVVAHP